MKKRQMYFRMITASLLRRRSRMVIALLAIAIGATILSGLVTIYVDVPKQMGNQFRNYGANMIFTAVDGELKPQQQKDAISVIPSEKIVGAAPYRYETVRINDRPVMAAGTDMKEAEKTSPFWAINGKWPANGNEIMVGKNVAATYNFKVGDKLTCSFLPGGEKAAHETPGVEENQDEVAMDNYLDFTITGILDSGGKEEDYVYMSLEDMETLTGEETTYDICELSVSATSDELNQYVGLMKSKDSTVNPRLVKRVTQSETTVLTKLQALVLLVTIVVLALTMICVATTMTAVVAERRKEIGLRKALGASNKSIIAEFMGEGLVLGAVGGLIGAFLGFAFAQMVSINVFKSSIDLMPWLIPVTIVASVIVTGIACMIPIRSATDVDPALVLKGE